MLLHVADVADQRPLPSAARLSVQWVTQAEKLIKAARALTLPVGDGYAWCAGEASAMASLRDVLVEEKGMDRHAVRAAAYWKRGAIAHHDNLEA